ncbi:MAG: protein kinase [Polyangiales bacterium]
MPGLGSDRFELVRPAGEGSYGVVYEARDRLSGGRVAVKMLFDTSATAEERFGREVSLLADLHHPSIVHYVAHGTADNGQRYLVMEWLEGITLRDRLEHGPLAVREVIDLARRVVMALAFAEHKGIVHRDIKPANVFLVNGAPAAAKLLDFGIAQRVSDTQRLTATGLAIGTPTYMSPEQALGEAGIDTRSDEFSFGTVLYECLAGVVPFDAPQAMATLAKICFEEPMRLESRVPDAPFELSALVHAMLQKKRDDRPTFQAVAESLTSIGSETDGHDLAVTRRSIHRRGKGDQRILAAVFVGAVEKLPAAVAEELRQVIARYGGRAERLLDGSRILLPGQQIGADEQAVVAAQCALAVNQMLARRAPIVVCTGRGQVGEQQPLGELFERGAALLASTPPGQVRVDDVSAALLDARFELAGDEQAGHTLTRERSGGEAPRTVLGQTTAFVGRDRELTQISMIADECRDEKVARAVLVMAPAGGGKSRLRHELLERLREREEPWLQLAGRGDSMHSGTQFGVLAPAIHAWAEIAGSDPVALKRSKLAQRVSALLPAPRATLVAAFLGEMIGVHFPDAGTPELRSARSEPQIMADRMLASWLEWLDALSATAPVLICVEDLHWSDPASLRFLDAALRNAKDRALLVLAFARPEVREQFPSLWSERDLIEIRLSKLTARACAKLLDALGDVALAASERASVIERADGNPFFLEELVRAHKSRKTGEFVPDTILGILQARLDALGEEPKQLVRAASVYGQSFRVDGARALFGAEAASFDFHRWLAVLCEREVIFPRGAPSEQAYAFRHAMLRDAAYVLLPEEDRALGHRLAATWLEGQSDEPALLADHRERGGDRAGAARCWARAAAQAFDAGSLDDVLRFGERAISCGVRGEELGRLAALMAEAYSYLEDEPRAAEWAERARDSLSPGTAAWWRSTQVGAVAYLRLGHSDFEMLAMHVLANFEADDPLPEQALAVAYLISESLRLMRDDLAEALLALLPPELPESLKGRPEGCLASAHAVKAYRIGDLSEALRHARMSLEAQRRAGSLRDIADSLGLAGFFLAELGVYDEAETFLREQVQLGQRIGSLRDVSYGQLNLGAIHARRGQHEQAEPMLREALAGYTKMGAAAASFQAEALAQLTGVRTARGDHEGAAAAVAQARQLSGLEPSAEALVLARASSLALARGDGAEALALSTRAEELARTNGVTEFAAPIQLAHIAALNAGGASDAARAVLAEGLEGLDARAALISDLAMRASFLESVTDHARLRALAGLGASAAALAG